MVERELLKSKNQLQREKEIRDRNRNTAQKKQPQKSVDEQLIELRKKIFFLKCKISRHETNEKVLKQSMYEKE